MTGYLAPEDPLQTAARVARVFRTVTPAVAIAVALGAAGSAIGAPATTAPATTAPPATSTPAPATTPAPALTSLRMPNAVSAQQGHARFLVGAKLATPSKLTIQLLSANGRVVQTTTDAADRPAGRAYVRVEATDSSGYQLLAGAYKVRVRATDAQNRTSTALEKAFTLKLTSPRGLFDAYTIPLWGALRRQMAAPVPGQLVAVVGVKGKVLAAGLRRGDIITAMDGRDVTRPGAWAAALRALPGDRPVAVQFNRKGVVTTANVEASPDWTAAPDYATSLKVAVKRDPGIMAYSVAQARQLIDAGRTASARAVIESWPAPWRTGAPGEIVQGELLAKQKRWKQSLGAYNRARAKDRGNGTVAFGRGVALSALGKTPASEVAFATAARLDPTDSAAAAFQAYALLQGDRTPEALAAAQRAVTLDPRYADAFLPYGISLLASGDRANGIVALRRGLLLLEEPDRANRLIVQHLEPTDP